MDNFSPDNDSQFINESADKMIAESADLVDFLNNENDLIEMNDVADQFKFLNLDQSYWNDDVMSDEKDLLKIWIIKKKILKNYKF